MTTMNIQQILDYLWANDTKCFVDIIHQLHNQGVSSRDIKIAIDHYIFDARVIR
jgi:hypothetical protein